MNVLGWARIWDEGFEGEDRVPRLGGERGQQGKQTNKQRKGSVSKLA